MQWSYPVGGFLMCIVGNVSRDLCVPETMGWDKLISEASNNIAEKSQKKIVENGGKSTLEGGKGKSCRTVAERLPKVAGYCRECAENCA